MNKEIQQLNTTTYKTTPKDDPKDRIEVIIGDDKEQDFKPQVKLKRWDGECDFSVRLKENGTETATVVSKDDKVTWDKGNFKIEFYEAENAHKFVWFLKKKPKTNKVEFTIQSKGLVFYYQPELEDSEVQEMAEREGITLLEAKRKCRPENVVGSYAVYMENPGTNWVGGKEYKAGKFGHIYRPHLYDSNGLEAWGDLHIENGIYSVEIPQDFLDKAVFPIFANDTFGYETKGVTSQSYAYTWDGGTEQTYRHGSYFLASKNGTIDKLTIALSADSSVSVDTMVFVNEKDSVATNSHGEIGNSERLDLSLTTTKSWYDFDFNDESIISGRNYIFNATGNAADIPSDFHDADVWKDSGGDADSSYRKDFTTSAYSVAQEDPFVSAPYFNYIFSIYATYTPAATTNIKSYNGLLKASIKSINGLAIASIKSINSLE